MKTLLASLVLFSASALAGSALAASEPSTKSQMVQRGIESCNAKGFKTLGEKDDCIARITQEANELYPARGSDSYSRKHYAGLSKEEAEKALIRLQAEWKDAPAGGYFSAARREVTKQAVAEEGWWIQINILDARQSQDDPWFIECDGFKTANIMRRCPLGKGGEQ